MLFAQGNESPGVLDGALNFEPVADDAGIAHEGLDLARAETGDGCGVEPSKSFAVGIAALEDGEPTQASLGSLKDEELEKKPIIMDWDTPLGIVICGEEGIAETPGTAGERRHEGGWHGHITVTISLYISVVFHLKNRYI